jgi:hypothetical protein
VVVAVDFFDEGSAEAIDREGSGDF